MLEWWGFAVESIDEWARGVGISKPVKVFATFEEYAAHLDKHGDRHTPPDE